MIGRPAYRPREGKKKMSEGEEERSCRKRETFTSKSRASSGGEAGGVKVTTTCAALSSKEKQKRIKGKRVCSRGVFSPGLRERVVNNNQDQESWGLDDGCRSRRCLVFFFP